ncbi:hypothetical protein JOQ06_001602 [Pogonophryne albipinna]|uniref:Uncharacterized protein n=1 Tax=Pogonophryne albipinna TaxID=1090488 RepID=A0AAD6B5E2_9TELE|nr:hypothetical protein JOQ06_001602 [Pogonophryne albipinna]
MPVAKKFDIPTLDLKVFDVTKTEVDEEVFEFLIQKQDLGVLEICLPQDPNEVVCLCLTLCVCVCRTSPSRRVKEEYAKGITSLFPNLADPRSKFGFEHYYKAKDGSGYLAWRLKFVQKGASEGQKKTLRQSLTGGPKAALSQRQTV